MKAQLPAATHCPAGPLGAEPGSTGPGSSGYQEQEQGDHVK